MNSGPMSACLVTAVLLLLVVTTSSAFTSDQQKALVVSHNRLRQAVMPQAADMHFVVWDKDLENLATKAAKSCPSTAKAADKKYGQNIYTSASSKIEDVTDITLAWYSEKANLKSPVHEPGNCKVDKQCGHYTQMMLAEVTKIGCGMSNSCNGAMKTVVYCLYSKAQKAGSSVFIEGDQCSKCSVNMPFCLYGLCINKKLAKESHATAFDNTVTENTISCQLSCADCGTRHTTDGVCKCTCGDTDSTGGTCTKSMAGAAARCSPCRDSPACQNDGREDLEEKSKGTCRCKCESGFFGDRCQISKDVFDSSVKLVIGGKPVTGKKVIPPVSRSLFNSKLWPSLQEVIATAVNTFCRAKADNFGLCCPGKTFPESASVLKSAAHINAKDVKFTESSIQNVLKDGSLTLLVHAQVPDSAMCKASVSRRKRSAGSKQQPKFLPESVLLPAIKQSSSAISTSMKDLGVELKLGEKASTASVPGDSGMPGAAAPTKVPPSSSTKTTTKIIPGSSTKTTTKVTPSPSTPGAGSRVTTSAPNGVPGESGGRLSLALLPCQLALCLLIRGLLF